MLRLKNVHVLRSFVPNSPALDVCTTLSFYKGQVGCIQHWSVAIRRAGNPTVVFVTICAIQGNVIVCGTKRDEKAAEFLRGSVNKCIDWMWSCSSAENVGFRFTHKKNRVEWQWSLRCQRLWLKFEIQLRQFWFLHMWSLVLPPPLFPSYLLSTFMWCETTMTPRNSLFVYRHVSKQL